MGADDGRLCLSQPVMEMVRRLLDHDRCARHLNAAFAVHARRRAMWRGSWWVLARRAQARPETCPAENQFASRFRAFYRLVVPDRVPAARPLSGGCERWTAVEGSALLPSARAGRLEPTSRDATRDSAKTGRERHRSARRCFASSRRVTSLPNRCSTRLRNGSAQLAGALEAAGARITRADQPAAAARGRKGHYLGPVVAQTCGRIDDWSFRTESASHVGLHAPTAVSPSFLVLTPAPSTVKSFQSRRSPRR
jgi:hypothetical protein